MKVKNKILAVRKLLNMSLQDIANAAEISKTQVHDLEHGKCDPTLSTARSVASALMASVDDIWPVE